MIYLPFAKGQPFHLDIQELMVNKWPGVHVYVAQHDGHFINHNYAEIKTLNLSIEAESMD